MTISNSRFHTSFLKKSKCIDDWYNAMNELRQKKWEQWITSLIHNESHKFSYLYFRRFWSFCLVFLFELEFFSSSILPKTKINERQPSRVLRMDTFQMACFAVNMMQRSGKFVKANKWPHILLISKFLSVEEIFFRGYF